MISANLFQFHRPFSYINSYIRVYDPLNNIKDTNPSNAQGASTESLVQASGESGTRVSPFGVEDMRVIGETQQQWAPLRRRYNLFTYHHSPEPATDMGAQSLPLSASGLSQTQQMQLTRSGQSGQEQGEFNQFAYVDEPFLSWDFALRSADNRLIGSVNRDFAGFGRELFTDTGVYALRMDSANEPTGTEKQSATGMTLDQRAVMLASAVSVDFDYFSRHSGSGGFGFMPMWIPGMGGDAAAGAAGRAGAAGGMAEGVGAGAAGAGTMAGYEAMQRGMTGDSNAQDAASDQQPSASMDQQPPPPPGQTGPYGDVWAEEQHQDTWGQEAEDPWNVGDDDGGDDGGDGFDLF